MDQFALENKIKEHIKRAGLSQAAVARKLHYTPEQFNKWVRGVNRIPDVAIQEIADLLGLTEAERTELFTLAGYVAVNALHQETDPAIQPLQTNPSGSATSDNKRGVTINLGSTFFIEALQDWSNNFFHWSEIPDHFRSSWAGRVIYVMRVIAGRITPGGVLMLGLSALLALITIELLTPVLVWPQDNADARLLTYLQYGLATLIIPLLVAFVTPPDQSGLFELETFKQQTTFWFLKFIGALVGFWVFSAIVIIFVLSLYYFGFNSLTIEIRAVLALIPLFLSYVVARRIPIDRYKMFDGELRPHPSDRFILAVFLFVGPFTAFFLYFSYWFLSDRKVAPVALILCLTGIALWEYRKQRKRREY